MRIPRKNVGVSSEQTAKLARTTAWITAASSGAHARLRMLLIMPSLKDKDYRPSINAANRSMPMAWAGWSGRTANLGSSPAGASAVTRSPQQARRPPNGRTWVTSSLIGSKVEHSVCKPLYALRSRIKCFIAHLKEQRCIATQFDRTATSFLGFVLLGMHSSRDQVCP
jgi:hypothetical protein